MGCLDGLNILYDAMSSQELLRIAEVIRALGGRAVALEDVAEEGHPDLLLATSVTTPAYQAYNKEAAGIPKVSLSWLQSCLETKNKAPYAGHELKPLTGITISISGAFAREKNRYAELIKRNGGIHSPELTKQCTHLVIMRRNEPSREPSVKETHARAWETVFLVWNTWLDDIAQAGYYKANEVEHRVPEPENSGTKDSLAMASNRLQTSKSLGTVEKRDAGCATETSAGTVPARGNRVVSPRFPTNMASSDKARPDPASDKNSADLRRAESSIMPGASAAANPPLQDGGSGSADDDTLFLSGALVHLACCSPTEQLDMLRILREGGCTRRPDLRNDVTHVVVGSDLTSAELQALVDHAKKFGHISSIVKLDWLKQCLAERHLSKVDESVSLSCTDLTQMIAQQALAAKAASTAADQTSKATQMSKSQTGTAKSSGGGCLEGFFFTLSALAMDGEDEKYARKVIRQAGGRMFDHRTHNLVTLKDKAFAICPPSLPPLELAKLMKMKPDFKLVPEKNRITPSWLDVSLDLQRPFLPVPYERVELQPLPHAVPIPGMQKVVVTASGLEHGGKDSVKRIVNILGGHYTIKMSLKNTHLVVPYAAGEKYNGAVRFNVIPVTCQWLIDVARAGKLLPESQYQPPPLEGNQLQAEQSQFPFEAADPTQNPAQSAANPGRAPQGSSLLRQVTASSQQPRTSSRELGSWKPFAKPSRGISKSRQGPSKLDALFSQLQTPAKGKKPPSQGLKEQQTWDLSPATIKTSVNQEDQGGAEGADDLATRYDSDAGQPQGVGSADDLNDILADVERLGGALAELPHQLSPSSQQDPLIPPHSRLAAASASSSDFSKGLSPVERRSRLKRNGGLADPASEDSNPGRGKRARSLNRFPRSYAENVPQNEFPTSQFCSQEIGYDGVIKTGNPYGSRNLRSSRMGAKSINRGP